MSRYDMLVRVLDGIRNEAKGTKHASLYANGSSEQEEIWQARSRAYIHLYIKVMFGIYDFSERESFVTDGGFDGGIDGYFIDSEKRSIFLIQSKFRRNSDNFERKPIDVDELLSMQIKRIMSGEEFDYSGHNYNGKILGLQRRIREIPDIGRWSTCVVIIANIGSICDEAILRLTDGLPYQVYNFTRSYKELLYPVLSGELFKATEINISLDLSNKSTGPKIAYAAQTREFECDITVVFVPTIEIAKLMSKYRNSILRYNPRCYIEFEGESVNKAIRETVTGSEFNDFALLNNGITIICDESGVNEHSGRKHRAQLFLQNPQIINGGQTAYTLSRIFEDTAAEDREDLFRGKEVLVKAIALAKTDDGDDREARRIALIERISNATNSQSVVTYADRTSRDPLQEEIQAALYEKYGLLYEKKRGEFGEGIRSSYLDNSDVITRNVFSRVYLASNGRLAVSLRKKIGASVLGEDAASDTSKLDRFILGLEAFMFLGGSEHRFVGKRSYAEVLPKVFAAVLVASKINCTGSESKGVAAAKIVQAEWQKFIDKSAASGAPYVRTVIDQRTRTQRVELKESRNAFDRQFVNDVEKYFTFVSIGWNVVQADAVSSDGAHDELHSQ